MGYVDDYGKGLEDEMAREAAGEKDVALENTLAAIKAQQEEMKKTLPPLDRNGQYGFRPEDMGLEPPKGHGKVA